MRRLFVGVLGGTAGFLPTLFFPSSPTQLAFTGLLFGFVLLVLGGQSSWWRRVLALLVCSLGCALAFLAALTSGLLVLGFFGGVTSESVAVFNASFTAFTLASVTGGLAVACAWSMLEGYRSLRVVRQGIILGGLLAQVGVLTLLLSTLFAYASLPFYFFNFYQPLLTIWCAGMLILVDSWATGSQPQPELSAM